MCELVCPAQVVISFQILFIFVDFFESNLYAILSSVNNKIMYNLKSNLATSFYMCELRQNISYL